MKWVAISSQRSPGALGESRAWLTPPGLDTRFPETNRVRAERERAVAGLRVQRQNVETLLAPNLQKGKGRPWNVQCAALPNQILTLSQQLELLRTP